MGEKSNDNTSPSPSPLWDCEKWHSSCGTINILPVSICKRLWLFGSGGGGGGGGGGGDTILLDSNSWKIDNNFSYDKQNPWYIHCIHKFINKQELYSPSYL